jgi:hypothetical protein
VTEEDNYYNAFEKDIVVVYFFFQVPFSHQFFKKLLLLFQEPTIFQYMRFLRMTLLDFISHMGGLLVLFLGFSLISGVEIVYWFNVKLGFRLCCQTTSGK